MTPKVSLRKAFEDPELLGSALAGPTWEAWRAILLAAMGEPLTKDELTTFTKFTGRTEPSIDHAPGAHDDIANSVAGALVTAYKEPGVSNFRNVIVFPKVGVA
jgi:hypothetical protein